MSKFKIVLLLGAFVFVSLKYGTEARSIIGKMSQRVLVTYVDTKVRLAETISEHFAQQEEIERLRLENQSLQKTALLSIAFASKLNDLLKEHNTKEYHTDVALIKSIGYVNLNDYGKIWIDFPDFDPKKIYGLLSQGYAAGIIVAKEDRPLGLLLSDPKSIFSVYVGSQKMQGVMQGNRKEVLVKYISQWLQPQIGDEVVTSGLDGIFFEGIKVGVVTEVFEEESSKTVAIKPYATLNVPSYMHVVKEH